ncbi:hypothetical protein [Streptococcus sp. Marseille-Q0941]|uniref:hypothetical protein n=1 Tax=Streptococcus sp. Marseille-Q0941 TaxID=2942206 RepID=UPI002072EB6F|nr:hypothetical protein [Streptococcus sp. Marseille-Q0941]
MKSLKGIIVGTILVFSIGVVVFLGLSFYAYSNLKYYSVYYAQQMPHKEGTEPDLVMLIENMGSIYTPKIEGIRYDDDGMNSIARNVEGRESIFSSSGEYLMFHSSTDDHYLFDRVFRNKSSFDKHYNDIEFNQQLVLNEIRETVQPVLDVQPKPLINLQWLFNKKYQDRFN